jgi:hypothetical protein
MEAPNTETDNGFPRRTAFQSALTNSSPAGGETAVTPAASDTQLKRPDPFVKPVVRTTSVAKPGESAAVPGPAASSGTPAPAPAASSTADWGLALKPQPSTGLRFKILCVLGLLGAAGGGYYGYQKYSSLRTDETQSDISDDLAENSSVEKDPYDMVTFDPSAEEELRLAGNETLDELNEDLETPRSRSRPNAAGVTHNSSNHVANHKKPKKKPVRDIDILDVSDDELDTRNLAQSEPALDDDDLMGLEEERPVMKKKKPNSYYDRDEDLTPAPRYNSRARPAGPRLESDVDMTASLPDEEPEIDLDIAGLDERETSRTRTLRKGDNRPNVYHANASNRRGTAISTVDARDEDEFDSRLEGYRVDDESSRRASSKTRIYRAGAEDLGENDPPPAGLRSTMNDESDSITGPNNRYGGASGDNPVRTRRPATTDFSDAGSSADPATTEMYRVLPDDNFWKISQKHYGTARYYQALMRHNQDRVSDAQKLRPGMQISIPPVAYLERHYASLIEKSAARTAQRSTASHRATARASDDRPRFDNPSRERGFDDNIEMSSNRSESDGYFYGKTGEPMYRIGPEDTLGSIAQKHLGRASRWTEIYEQNQEKLDSPDNLKVGTVIRLPSDASRLSLVPENSRRR